MIGTGGRLSWFLAAMSVATLLAGACGGPPVREIRAQDVDRSTADATTVQAVSDDVTEFATDLYRQMASGSENFAFSPVAIAVSLAMFSGSTSDSEQARLATLLHVRDTPKISAAQFNTGLGTLWIDLSDRSGEHRTDLRSGRTDIWLPASVWVQKDTSVDDAFKESLAVSFGSGINVVDFHSDPASARRAVDSWLSRASGGQLNDPLAHGIFDQSTMAALVSGFALQAPWNVRFPPTRTADHTFTLGDGSTVDVSMMSVHDEYALSVARGDGWQAVSIPYLGGNLSMILLVPTGIGLTDLEQRLDRNLLDSVFSALRPRPVDLTMPMFDLAGTLDLGEVLGFTPNVSSHTANADSATAGGSPGNAAGSKPTTKVLHQSNVSADEQGTNGAAATVVINTPEPDLKVDPLVVGQPFIFLIRDDVTGALLSLGRVADPRR